MENICDWNKCKKLGYFKAPIEKDNSKKFKWLCEEHVKIFNQKWDYFNGMSQNEIEYFLKSDVTWHRPTKEFGSPDSFFHILWNNALSDNFKMFEKNGKNHSTISYNFSSEDLNAFKKLDLEPNSSWPLIQKTFKTLVKKFHPDMNAGNKIYEEKLKTITIAYQRLKMKMKEIKNNDKYKRSNP